MFIKNSIGASALVVSLFASVGMAAQPAAAVPVTATSGSESAVRPLAFVICAFEGVGAGEKCAALGGTPDHTIPPNRTFIIEQVTGYCVGDDPSSTAQDLKVELFVVTDGVQVDHVLLGSRADVTGLVYHVSDDTRIYADRGSVVTVGLTGIPATDDRFCRLAFSGRLVR